MTFNEQTKYFVILFSTAFIISFFLLRAILEQLGWGLSFMLAVALPLSGLLAVLIALLLIKRNNRKLGILMATLYFSLLLIFAFTANGRVDTSNLLSGTWITRESDGENFAMDFFAQDSVRLIIPPSNARVVGYSLQDDRLKIFDEEGDLLFNWAIQKHADNFVVQAGADRLTFYKKK